jgi:2'-5' RNA ligase
MAAGDLAMIAVYPTATEAGRIAASVVGGSGEPPAKMHVTMVFLGEADDVDLKAAARAVGSVSGSTAPLSGKVGGFGLFSEGPDGYPQIAIPDVVGLAKMRVDLINALAEENITTPSEHDWVPHLTIDYVSEAILPDRSVLGVPLTFNQLSLAVDDERKDFPLDPEGASDDVHRPDRSGLSRAEQRRLALLERV